MVEQERQQSMEGFVKGDILVINFPFSDFSFAKRRPALVLAKHRDDYILCEITSNLTKDKFSIFISDSDLNKGVLKYSSIIKLYKIFTADKSLIAYKLGEINVNKQNEVHETLSKLILS